MATTNKVKGWTGVLMTEDSSSHWPTKRRHVYYETSRRAGIFRMRGCEVGILMRLSDGRNVATRQAVHGSAPCARTEVTGPLAGNSSRFSLP